LELLFIVLRFDEFPLFTSFEVFKQMLFGEKSEEIENIVS